MQERDDNLGIFRKSFREGDPLTEQERSGRRHAAVFALMTFDPKFFDFEVQSALGISFTEKQLTLARNYIRELPTLSSHLPDPYQDQELLDYAGRGFASFGSVLSYAIPEIMQRTEEIDGLQEGEFRVHAFEKSLLKDPTGVTFVHAICEYMEKSWGLERLMYPENKAIAEAYTEVLEYQLAAWEADPPPPFETMTLDLDNLPEDPNEWVNKRLEAFNFKERRRLFALDRANIGQQTGYVPDREGNLVHRSELNRLGCNLAVEQYRKAVELYLDC